MKLLADAKDLSSTEVAKHKIGGEKRKNTAYWRHHQKRATKKSPTNSFGFEEYACRFAEANGHRNRPASSLEKLGFTSSQSCKKTL